MEMIDCRLGDIAQFYNGRAYLMPELQSSGKYRIVRVGNFSGKDEWFYSDMELEPNKYCNEGDLLFKWACNFGPEFWHGEKAIYHYHIWKVQEDSKIIDKQFLFYLLKVMTPLWLCTTNGSTMVHITKETIENKIVTIPKKIEDQKCISSILEKLDKKIANNNKICSDIEKLVKSIYDYWFLQFEFPNEEGKPYKSSGGKMVYNEELKREIPEGWEVKTIGDLVIRNNKKFDYKSEQINIDLSVMPSDSIVVNQFNSSKDFSTNLFLMNKGDILFGSIRPYLHKACIAPCKGTFAGTVYSYSVKENKDYNLVLTTLTRKSFFDYAESCCQGTKMPVVRNESILEYKLAYNSKIAKLFNDYIDIKDSIPNMSMQNKELASLRDFLLPMLMNGQVTFKED